MRYKLLVIDDDGREVGEIGTFTSEYALAQWAKENSDSLKDWEQL
jgi:hypothetical protein